MKTVIKTPKAEPEHERTCTELELHAYVDGEIASVERANVFIVAQHSPAIRAQLKELEHLKKLIHDSYAEIEAPH
jgi:anti-sigma factor RsiW